VSNDPAREILIEGARALAHVDGLDASLKVILDAAAESLGVASAAIVVENPSGSGLEIVAGFGMDERVAAGLTEAMRRPEHPIARTFTASSATFDVAPTVPGGPALRSHLPLIVTGGGTENVVGVLALAHDQPIEPATRPIVQAAADLAAVAIERHRRM
jgi:GAF domain-containing protein